MNKNVIIYGTICFFIACIYVPLTTVVDYFQYVHTGYGFIWQDNNVCWNSLAVELIGILVCTLGFAYGLHKKQ